MFCSCGTSFDLEQTAAVLVRLCCVVRDESLNVVCAGRFWKFHEREQLSSALQADDFHSVMPSFQVGILKSASATTEHGLALATFNSKPDKAPNCGNLFRFPFVESSRR